MKVLWLLLLVPINAFGSGCDNYAPLAVRVRSGDVAAFHEAMALMVKAKTRREHIRLGEITALFIIKDPTEYLRAQRDNMLCYGANLYDPDVFADSAADAYESGRRGYELKSVSDPSLTELKQQCLYRLNVR